MRLRALLLLLPWGCAPVESARGPHELPASSTTAEAGLQSEGRPTSPTSPIPRYDPGEVVESVVSPEGHFRIHFSRVGVNAVPAADADGNGTPDAVEVVARAYDRVEDFYVQLGFRRPLDDSALDGDNGGDGLFDVYLVDFAGRADGAFRLDACEDDGTRCVGHMLQENDFMGYGYPSYEEAVDILASHEFFHAVQAAYRPGLGGVASEGTAVWASERFDPALDDLEHFAASYFNRPDRALVLDPDGPAATFSYGSGVFFQFIGERFGDAALVGLWEESLRAPTARWPVLLDTVLRQWGADFDTAFAEFARWNFYTGTRATSGQGYARAAGFAQPLTSARTLPTQEADVRLALAATRYFEVPGGADTVLARFEPNAGQDASKLHLLVAAVTDTAVLQVARAEGQSPLTASVDAKGATRVLVAVVDGRHEGVGRYGKLCLTADAKGAPCVQPTPEEPGEPEQPHAPGDDDGGGCAAAPGGAGALLLSWLGFAARGRRRVRPVA
ncbi:hypothetical protein LZ198_17365 [Myxococcus sp. K15C18031901]|uniref:MXAN_6640 family putative metalloprotease n=1 Tax=Myxococcus dinghuensis TaxID=2906761 RepID=UPI0020A70FB4|nr:MXAN_6640 family putative metalloprotease [Myxococcus dinghuensis]MCP3100642.1 hypothetical protein [Myxococcus dinghuensis]